MNNQYKIKLITDIKPEWFGVVVEKSLANCRKSNDGLYAVLKLPFQVQSIDDVPELWKADYLANEPYMNHAEIIVELSKPEWQSPSP